MATSDQHIHKSVTPYKQSPWLCRLHLHVSDSIDLLHTNSEPDPPGLFRRLSDKTTLVRARFRFSDFIYPFENPNAESAAYRA
jgi:hypothetical protein